MDVVADENLPARMVHELSKRGMRVQSIRETIPGFSDAFILDMFRNTGCIIITYDNDFPELLSKSSYGLSVFLLKSQADNIIQLSISIVEYLKKVVPLPDSVHVFELGKAIRVRQFTH